MDSSRILVMDAGQAVEFDEPVNLINQQDSLFNSMIDSTGSEMKHKLRNMARQLQLVRSQSSSRAELNEKIQETITAVIEEDNPDLDVELSEIDESSLDKILSGS